MLIQISFFVLMLFGVAALTVDMGYVRLSQSQMQNAADAAAIEGLRSGRDQARAAVRLAYDDDFLLDTANTSRNLGAGPAIATDDTTDGLNASQQGVQGYELVDPRVYVPNPELNAGNAVHGDLVVGEYHSTASHAEDASYVRSDLDVRGTGAFLVRLRRTDGRNALDRQPGISSSGSSLPLMFGRGTTIPTEAAANGWAPRRDGITVRSTAIASARPALRVGTADTGRAGATAFGLTHTFWASLPDGATCNLLPADPAGHLSAPDCGVAVPAVAGEFYAGAPAQVVVGTPLTAATRTVPDGVLVPAYVPIYDEAGPTAGLVIGFGYVRLTSAGGILVITVTHSQIATDNVSGLVATAVPDAVLAANRSLEFALLAPVLVR